MSVQEKAREVLVGILDKILGSSSASEKNEILRRFIDKDDDCIGSYRFPGAEKVVQEEFSSKESEMPKFTMPLHLAEAFVQCCREEVQVGQLKYGSFYR
jgi:hypothetical protein